MSVQSVVQSLAHELASQLPALAQDSPLNAAQVIANRITEAVQPELGQLEAQLKDANQRISEIAYNCPSCGRHDFGLFKDPVSECVKLKDQLKTESAHRLECQEIIFKLRQQVAELEEDKARVDWLGTLDVEVMDWDTGNGFYLNQRMLKGATFRQAIDSIRKEKP